MSESDSSPLQITPPSCEEDDLSPCLFTQVETDFGAELLTTYLDEVVGVSSTAVPARIDMIRKVVALFSNLKASVELNASSPLFRLQITNVSDELQSLLLESFRMMSSFDSCDLTQEFEELAIAFGETLQLLINRFRKWDEWKTDSFEKEFASMLVPVLGMLNSTNWVLHHVAGKLIDVLLSSQCSLHDEANWEIGGRWVALNINALSNVMCLILKVGDFSYQFYLLKLVTSWLASVPVSHAHKLLRNAFPDMNSAWRLQLLGETICDSVIVSSLRELNMMSKKSPILFTSCFELDCNGKVEPTSCNKVKWTIVSGESYKIQFITWTGEIVSLVRIKALASFGHEGSSCSEGPPTTFHLKARMSTHFFRTVNASQLLQKLKELGLNMHSCASDGCRRLRNVSSLKKPTKLKLSPRDLKIVQGYKLLPIKRIKIR